MTATKSRVRLAIAILGDLVSQIKCGDVTRIDFVNSVNLAESKLFNHEDEKPAPIQAPEVCNAAPEKPVSMVVPEAGAKMEAKSKAAKEKPPGLD